MLSNQEGDICVFCKVSRDLRQKPRIKRSQVLVFWNRHYFFQSPHYFDTVHSLCVLGLLWVKTTEWTVVHGNPGPARCCLGGVSWKGNQSSVNILHTITLCWTLPNTFMEALGKVFLYQHVSSGHCDNYM